MSQTNSPTWAIAFIIGSLLNIGLFLVLPKLGRTDPPAPPPVITLDFVAWQLPVKEKAPEAKPKPKPKKVVEKKEKPKQQLKKPEPKPAEPVKPKPVEKPVFTEEPEITPPDEPPKPIEPEPVEEPVLPTVAETAENIVDEEELPTPAPIFQLTSMPRMIHRETPIYPAIMRAQGKEGKVRLEVLIDSKGKIRKVTVIKSAGEAFDKAAIAAISNSSFTPGNIDGKPVAVLLKLPVNFTLR